MRFITISIFVSLLCINAFGAKPTKGGNINIIYTNDVEGSVDTCGCAMDPGGGAVRRVNWYKMNSLSPLDTVYINGGNTLFTHTDYMDYEVKYLKAGAQILADSMSMMNIDAYTPGEQDLKLGLDFFLSASKNLPVLITNSGNDKFKKEIIINKGGLKIGIIGILSEKLLSKELATALDIKDAVASLKTELPKLKKETDLVILIVHTDDNEIKAILKNTRGIDVILSTGVNEELTRPMIANNSIVVRTLPGGDSIGLLKYEHKNGAKKVDVGFNNSMMAKSEQIELIIKTIDNKKTISNLEKEKSKLEDLVVKADDSSSKFESKIDFLGKMYAGKNGLDARVKKYEALRKTSAPRFK